MRHPLLPSFALAALLLLTTATHGFSQTDIAAARAQGTGATVTVSGIVTNGDELGTIRYVQDATAGLAIYSSQLSGVERGDSITVTGTLKEYNNLLEMDPVTGLTVHSSGNPGPAPLVLTPDEFDESYEGMLVRVNGAAFTSTGVFSRTSYTIEAGGESGQVYINSSGSELIGTPIPSGIVSVIGPLGQYQSNYQILPRDLDDIVSSLKINLDGLVTVDQIQTGGFRLQWTTDVAGSTQVKVGLTSELEMATITEAGTGTDHTVTLSGFSPSQVVYARPFSVFDGDTAKAPLGVYITQSESGGDIRVLFNRPVDPTVSMGLLEAEVPEFGIDVDLVGYIQQAEESIDMAIYNINDSELEDISGALNDAHQRGVTVRVVYNKDTDPQGIKNLVAGIGKQASPAAVYPDYGIMHNKFVIFDALSADPDLPLVWTGSTNFTEGQILTDPNDVILIQDQSLAKAYRMEFNEMFGSEGDQPDPDKALFGPDKTDNTPHHFRIGGKDVELYFSPSDGTNARIISAIGTADRTVDVASMLITRTDIASALANAEHRNSPVRVLIDDYDSYGETVIDILQEAGAEVRKYASSGLMHHKYMIVDQAEATSDPLVLTGSHNWSSSADLRNDENTLIVHDQGVANAYYQEFVARFAQGETVITGISETGVQTAGMSIYPNPASREFHIRTSQDDPVIESVLLLDVSGRVVGRWNKSHTAVYALPVLPEGLYFLQIRTEGGRSQAHKLMIR
ncbi:MAG: phospholipase D-like domain-containing protein [Bacteroidales bacterium]